jgi:hypothetical protein
MKVHAVGVNMKDDERYVREAGLTRNHVPRRWPLDNRELRQPPGEFVSDAIAREVLFIKVEDGSFDLV